MKRKVFSKSLICFLCVCITIGSSFAAVYAVDGEEESIVTEPAVTEPIATQAPEETEPPVVETEPPTEEPVPIETQPVTEAPAEPEYPEATEEPAEQTEAQGQYYATEAETQRKSLPTVPQTTKPKNSDNGEKDYTYGYISWACVGAGILAIAVILISTKHSGRRKRR